MAFRTPTVNREFAQLPAKTDTAPRNFAISHETTSPSIHDFLAGGNGDSQLWQVRFTTWTPQFTTWFTLFGRQMAQMAISAAEIAILTVHLALRRPTLSRYTTTRGYKAPRTLHCCRCPVACPVDFSAWSAPFSVLYVLSSANPHLCCRH